jgi:hypothetical protein
MSLWRELIRLPVADIWMVGDALDIRGSAIDIVDHIVSRYDHDWLRKVLLDG